MTDVFISLLPTKEISDRASLLISPSSLLLICTNSDSASKLMNSAIFKPTFLLVNLKYLLLNVRNV